MSLGIHSLIIVHFWSYRKSFEILPVVQIENKSPIHLEEHCLGLESWCVPHIYCYAYKNLMNLRQMKGKIRGIPYKKYIFH